MNTNHTPNHARMRELDSQDFGDDFTELAKSNYAHLMGYNESLTKGEYLERFKSMYSLSGDPRNKAFFEMAEIASFESIQRSHKGVFITKATS